MLRWVTSLVLVALIAGCSGKADLDKPPVPLGDFSLYHNIVVASKAQRGPLSREATEEQLAEAMRAAVAERFGRYNGARRYHFGISIEGYLLAEPGIPLVVSPKSILILNLTVWDDAAGKKLNDEPFQITVIETLGAGFVVGSGYTMTAEEQLVQLSQNAAKEIEFYLLEQMEELGWFERNEAEVADASPSVSDTASN